MTVNRNCRYIALHKNEWCNNTTLGSSIEALFYRSAAKFLQLLFGSIKNANEGVKKIIENQAIKIRYFGDYGVWYFLKGCFYLGIRVLTLIGFTH